MNGRHRADEPPSSRRPAAVIAATLVAAVLGILLVLNVVGDEQGGETVPVAAATPVPSGSTASAAGPTPESSGTVATSTGAASGGTAGSATASSTPTASSASAPTTTPRSTARPSSAASPSPSRQRPPTLTIQVTGAGPSWITVRTWGGRVLADEALARGQRRTFDERQLDVVVNNRGATRVVVNGEVRRVPTGQTYDEFRVERS